MDPYYTEICYSFLFVALAAAAIFALEYLRDRRERERIARQYEELERIYRESMAAPPRIVDRDGRLTYGGWFYHREEPGDYAAFDATECVGSDGRFLLFDVGDIE